MWDGKAGKTEAKSEDLPHVFFSVAIGTMAQSM
jgi:hypothetical protein